MVASDEREGGDGRSSTSVTPSVTLSEAASGYGLLHGEAVALGMVAALDVGAALGVGPAALAARARALLAASASPSITRGGSTTRSMVRLSVDKKRRGGVIRFVFCPAAGETQPGGRLPAGARPILRRGSGPTA